MGTLDLSVKSGVGKSECALWHSSSVATVLVADDLTYIKKVSDRELIGTSSELSRGYMECRGLGIIDVGETIWCAFRAFEKAH